MLQGCAIWRSRAISWAHGLHYKVQYTEKFGDVSEAAGLATVQSVAITSTRGHACYGPGELKEPGVLVEFVAGVERQLLLRFVFACVLESALQLNVQTTVFAIQRSLTTATRSTLTESQRQTLVSIGFSLVLAFLKLLETKSCLDFVRLMDGGLAEPPNEGGAALLRQYRRCRRGIATASVILALALF